MKRLAAVAAVMLLAACAPRDEATIEESPDAAPAMAPAPADTMMMQDTIMMQDTMHHDTTHPEMTETPAAP